ncbi:hypothetical protein [Actibacterium sp. D379-3]
MTFPRLAVALAVFALPADAASPIAEIICAPRDEMAQRLSGQYGHVRNGIGMRGPESMVEVWTSERSGDWTLLMTYADGKSCIVAMGENWADLRPVHDPA